MSQRLCLPLVAFSAALVSVLGLEAFTVSAAPVRVAQSQVAQSDVQVKGPTVNCQKVGTSASAPDVGVSIPNPSKLVPNVGKILRKGVGVPAPDSNAPNVSVPKVSASTPTENCASVTNDNQMTTPASVSGSQEMNSGAGSSVSGLW